MPRPILTLVSDFGATSAYVAMLKGRLLGLMPEANLIDLDHDLPSDDLFAAAFLLLRVYSYYPAGTVHLAGIDRGTGPDRALVVEARGQRFLAMDNGILSLVLERETKTLGARVWSVPITQRTPFAARDTLAALAAQTGISGEPCTDWQRLSLPQPAPAADGGVDATVLHVDRFGNLMTNLTSQSGWARPTLPGTRFLRHYGEAESGELFCYWGAEGWLEIAVAHGSAAQRLRAQRGTVFRMR